MYNVSYYKDRNGNSPIEDYIKSLAAKGDKDQAKRNLTEITERSGEDE